MSQEIFEFDWRTDELAFGKDFFNVLSLFKFNKYLRLLTEFNSLVVNEHACYFPHDAEGMPEFEGIKFGFLEKEIIVDFETFKKLVLEAGLIYAQKNPDVAAETRQIIDNFRDKQYLKSDYIKL